MRHDGALTADGDWRVFLKNLVVLGDQGFVTEDAGGPRGVTASDAIR